MLPVKYVQSFSSGQITIPKEYRDKFGLQKKFWLKLSVWQNKIVAEPVENGVDKTSYQEKLLSITGDWINEQEVKGNRQEVEQQLSKRVL